MDCPVQSADLNPIEHLWGILKQQIDRFKQKKKGFGKKENPGGVLLTPNLRQFGEFDASSAHCSLKRIKVVPINIKLIRNLVK